MYREIMMALGKYLVYVIGLLELVLTAGLFLNYFKYKKHASLYMGFVGLGILFSSAILSLGDIIGDGLLLKSLSVARIIAKGFFSSLIMAICVYVLDVKDNFRRFMWIITLLLMGVSVAAVFVLKVEQFDIASIIGYDLPYYTSFITSVLGIPLFLTGIVVLFKMKTATILFSGLFVVVFSLIAPLTNNMDLAFIINMVGEMLMLYFFLLFSKKR